MSVRRGVANMGLKRRGVPLSGCERHLRGRKSAEEGRCDINTQTRGR